MFAFGDKPIGKTPLELSEERCGGALRQTLAGLPTHVRARLARTDAGFGSNDMKDTTQALGLKCIFRSCCLYQE